LTLYFKIKLCLVVVTGKTTCFFEVYFGWYTGYI